MNPAFSEAEIVTYDAKRKGRSNVNYGMLFYENGGDTYQ